ncbi:hypothetical protein JTB14_010763 [Gonioctena quinquepunctata]|nr:hypothetical protein JTB14_010763 [Gonioctena quinquepunctata]
MNRVVCLVQAGMRQIDAAKQMGVSQSVISRLWRRFRESGSPAENPPGRGRCTTAVQDRFFILTARRQLTIPAPELVADLQRAHNLTIWRDTVRNRLHEGNLHSRRPLRCPSLSRRNRPFKMAQDFQNWDAKEWVTVSFTDKSRFEFHPDSQRTRVSRLILSMNNRCTAVIIQQGGLTLY